MQPQFDQVFTPTSAGRDTEMSTLKPPFLSPPLEREHHSHSLPQISERTVTQKRLPCCGAEQLTNNISPALSQMLVTFAVVPDVAADLSSGHSLRSATKTDESHGFCRAGSRKMTVAMLAV